MREIKFRAWDGKEMNYSYKDLGTWFLKNDDRISLMQYIGLKDKNNKKIYEGDIVKSYIDNSPIKTKRIDKVYFDVKQSGYLPFIDVVDYGDMTYMDKFYKNCEVIGDIYENPELLQK